MTSPILIAATGSFGHPHRPELPGLDSFTGTLLHAADYREPTEFAGQRVIVVGAGNTAVQIAAELAEHARVSLATRRPVRYVPQRPLGRDLHFWFALTRVDRLPVGAWIRQPPTQPVLDTGHYRAAVNADRTDRRPLFTRVDGSEVAWPDGSRERVDTIILATGYQPDLSYLDSLGALSSSGWPLRRRGLSTTNPGLGYVGMDWPRSPASASLRGVGRDARYLVSKLAGA